MTQIHSNDQAPVTKVILPGYRAVQVGAITSLARGERDTLDDTADLWAALAIRGSTCAVLVAPIYWGTPARCSTRFKEYFKVWRLSLQPAGSHVPLNLYLYKR